MTVAGYHPPPPDRDLQPLLHDLVATVLAPSSALSGPDGQIRATGVQGAFHADLRVLSLALLRLDGREAEPVLHALTGAGRARFVSLARWLGDPGPDPTVRLDRVRRMTAGGLIEEITLASTAASPIRTTVSVDLGCDFAPIELVKSGHPARPAATAPTVEVPAAAGVPGSAAGTGAALHWRRGSTVVTAAGEGATADAAAGRLSWPVELAPRGRTTLRWRLAVHDEQAVVAAPGAVVWHRPVVVADDARLTRLVDRSVDDLRSLLLTETAAPEDTFLGAGVPWFLTLFGRDSLWAARMLLPLGTELAAGTLRVLARRQGVRLDPETGEAPGKIMHELRREVSDLPDGWPRLPAAYYGTVDATMLWVSLLHDAWRWGLPEAEVAALLPALEAALGWLAEHADADGDGFVEYVDLTGRGLANQGWKDSFDAVRFHDGRRARAPIALVEVQGYAYAAARHGADLLDAFGRPGGPHWRDYADRLATAFRDRFWVDGPQGRHPALALDRDKRPVDSLTSNIGHLLGTGLLTPAESAEVAARLASPAMAGGFGLRTMAAGSGGYSPLSYHCGSIWAHDTAIVLAGLARAGFGQPAARLAEGLLTAAEAFDYRLPELYSGDDRDLAGRPVPYPASCRPQAWSAAAAVAILATATGLAPDAPARVLRLRPLPGAPLGAIEVTGLRLAGQRIDVRVDRDGTVAVTGVPAGWRIETEPVGSTPAGSTPTGSAPGGAAAAPGGSGGVAPDGAAGPPGRADGAAGPADRSVEQRAQADGEARAVQHGTHRE